MAVNEGIPDMRWINRHVPIADVARKLDLRFGQAGMIHCWHPEQHENGDRTPSVAIRKTTNRVKCFGCATGPPPMTAVDLVMDVKGFSVGAAALWLAEHFDVRRKRKGRHLDAISLPYRVGYEQPVELLVKSGLWASLSSQTQRIVPVLLAYARKTEGEPWKAEGETLTVQISNRAVMRYSGVRSFSSVSKAIRQLEEIEWLECLPSDARAGSVLRSVSTYHLTPYSDGLLELAQAMAAQSREEIEAERELRKQQRRARRRALDAATRHVALTEAAHPQRPAITKSTLSTCSVASERMALSLMER